MSTYSSRALKVSFPAQENSKARKIHQATVRPLFVRTTSLRVIRRELNARKDKHISLIWKNNLFETLAKLGRWIKEVCILVISTVIAVTSSQSYFPVVSLKRTIHNFKLVLRVLVFPLRTLNVEQIYFTFNLDGQTVRLPLLHNSPPDS